VHGAEVADISDIADIADIVNIAICDISIIIGL
jgi:hypothetical protein